jgi:hypothetical protein
MAATYRMGPAGSRSALNITTPTVIQATGNGWVYGIEVITAPTAAGGVYDTATTAGATTATQMAQITTTDVHVNLEGKPFFNGLVVNPGTGGVVAVYYDPAYITPPLNITN